MKNETIPYFDVITEIVEYFKEHYDTSEDSIFELIKTASWKIALKKEGHDENKIEKVEKYTIDQGMQRFKRKGTFEDYVELIDYVITGLPQIGIHHDERDIIRKALLKVVRKHMHHEFVVTAADSDDVQVFDTSPEPESESLDTSPPPDASSYKIPHKSMLVGRNVYGGLFLARFPYVMEHFGSPGANKLLKEMINNGYEGPRTIKEINRSAKYPLKNLCVYNKAFVDLYGEKHFNKMIGDSTKRKGIVGVFVKWAGTPEMVIKKAPEYWKKFYDFGRLESRLKEDGKGIVRLLDGRVNSSFCNSLTNYYKGIGKVIGYELRVEQTTCVFKGSDYCEWEITWGGAKHKTDATTAKVEEERGPESPMEKKVMTPNDIFNIVVSELEGHIGDILALGITKKALQKVGISKDYVSEVEMKSALNIHIEPALYAFMSPDKAKECVRTIEKKIGMRE